MSKQAKHILDLERELRLTNYENSQLSQRIQKNGSRKADKFFIEKILTEFPIVSRRLTKGEPKTR